MTGKKKMKPKFLYIDTITNGYSKILRISEDSKLLGN
jgi:hypothetical protein